jgi:hypothetical protein
MCLLAFKYRAFDDWSKEIHGGANGFAGYRIFGQMGGVHCQASRQLFGDPVV